MGDKGNSSERLQPGKDNCSPGLSPARIIVQLVVAVVVGLLVADFASWIFANVYAYVHGVKLSDLSDDFAMGFYAMAVAVAAFVLAAPLTYFVLQQLFRTSKKG